MTRTVAILAMPGVQLLDVSGPLDVFAEANIQAAKAAYRLRVIASTPGEIRSSSGTRLVPDQVIREGACEQMDTNLPLLDRAVGIHLSHVEFLLLLDLRHCRAHLPSAIQFAHKCGATKNLSRNHSRGIT